MYVHICIYIKSKSLEDNYQYDQIFLCFVIRNDKTKQAQGLHFVYNYFRKHLQLINRKNDSGIVKILNCNI